MDTGIIHISFAGHELKIIDRKNRVWKFEDHNYCGPIVLDRYGDPKDEQPDELSPFWEAVNCWYQQGKQVNKMGLCVWQKPTIQKMVHLGGRHYKLVP